MAHSTCHSSLILELRCYPSFRDSHIFSVLGCFNPFFQGRYEDNYIRFGTSRPLATLNVWSSAGAPKDTETSNTVWRSSLCHRRRFSSCPSPDADYNRHHRTLLCCTGWTDIWITLEWSPFGMASVEERIPALLVAWVAPEGPTRFWNLTLLTYTPGCSCVSGVFIQEENPKW